MIDEYRYYLKNEGKSINTIKSYIRHINGYLKWYSDSYGEDLQKLYRQNILDYKSYLQNNKRQHPKTINAKLAALIKLNEFLQDKGIQENVVVSKKDNIKVQEQFASPAKIKKDDVEKFRQRVLKESGNRNYSIVTIMAYAGLRISEVLNLRLEDIDLVAKELVVQSGKGNKRRVVCINSRIVNAVKEYLKERKDTMMDYLFISNKGNKVDRTVINKMFNKYSDKITPHTLRHFYCSYALESGFAVHEVANQAGHSNIHTTLLYTNPTIEEMKRKAELL